MNAIMFLALRASHVLVAAVWIGSSIFVATQVMPVIEASGASGGQVLMRLNHRMHLYMGLLGGTTVVTGLYLLWRFAGGFAAVGSTHAGVAFGVGGSAGILAGIIGGGVVGRSAAKAGALMRQAAATVDGPAKGELMQHLAQLRRRIQLGSKVTITLQLIALVLMSVGHYV